MFRKDNFIFGLIGGMLLPGLAWCYEYCLAQAGQHKSTIYLISIGLNLLLVRLSYKSDLPKTAGGVMFFTFIAALVLFYFKLSL